MGAQALSSAAALRRLEEALLASQSGHCIADFDWPVLARLLPSARRPRFEVLDAMSATSGPQDGGDFRARIAGMADDDAFELVRTQVREAVARILCLAVDRIETHRSLHDAGMDSLMAVELAHDLEQAFGCTLAVMSLNEGPSVDRIARRVTDALRAGAPAAAPAERLAGVIDELARQHGESATLRHMAQGHADAAQEAT